MVFPAQDPAVSIKIIRPRAKFNQKPRCLCRRPRVRRTCVVCLLSVARKRGKRGPTEPEYSGVGEILHAHFRHNTNVPSHFDPDCRSRSLQHLYEYGRGLLSQWAPAEMPSVPCAPGTALEPDPVGESASSMGTQIMQPSILQERIVSCYSDIIPRIGCRAHIATRWACTLVWLATPMADRKAPG